MLKNHKADLTSVTVWGFADKNSWLNNTPVKGRRNYPLLFNDQSQPKAAYTALMNL